ncbi:MAG: AAC(3) family N-acetyltransferase [Pseudomonadota bacterium]
MVAASDDLVGAEDLVRDLRALGVAEGDGLFVHSSLRSIGTVIGGARGLIEALITAVGPAGLIGMPGFSRDAYDPVDQLGLDVTPDRHARIRAQVPGYDPDRSSTQQNGAVAETFRHWPGAMRSPHPTSSVVLRGPDAGDLIAPHSAEGWATGPDTPWGRLRTRAGMKILLIGVGWNRASALHAAESIAAHRRTKVRHLKTGPGDAPWIDAPDVADDLDRLFPLVGTAWEVTGAVAMGRLGRAECRLTGYDALVGFAADWIGARNAADGVPAWPS